MALLDDINDAKKLKEKITKQYPKYEIKIINNQNKQIVN